MNANEEKRENRLKLVEDHIGRSLAQSAEPASVDRRAKEQRLSEMRQKLALQMERLRFTG